MYEFRKDINGLRGLAIISVVLFHLFPSISIFNGGYLGVDIFFVISGFLITRIAIKESSKGEFSLLNYFSKRVIRLFPVLLIVLYVSVIAGWLIL